MQPLQGWRTNGGRGPRVAPRRRNPGLIYFHPFRMDVCANEPGGSDRMRQVAHAVLSTPWARMVANA
jgi:hypothetical protein